MGGFFKFLLRTRIRFNLTGWRGIYFYAVLAGVISAAVASCFQFATHSILALLTGTDGERVVASFAAIPAWRRIFSLCVGAVLAGIVLVFAAKKIRKAPTPYMEAVSIGNGYIPVRSNLLRSLAAILTIGSGASIGREGPLVQTVTVFASVFGRRLNFSPPRLRLIVACSAAGAMAAVFHAPMAGALFVCEIVVGIMSIDIIAPLLVSSCTSYLIVSILGNSSPLYEISAAYLSINAQTAILSLILGVIASVCAKGWLVMLVKCRSLLNRSVVFLPFRLALAGVIVGTIAIYYPEVTGNGAHIIRGIVSMNFSLEQISTLFALKVFSVVLFFGLGAVGGVLTPTLTVGGILGFIFAQTLVALGIPLGTEEVIGFSLLGMAAFFTTAAAAPLTSLMLVLEFTMAGRMIYPLIIGVLVSYGISKLMRTKSMYASAVSSGFKSVFDKPLCDVSVNSLARRGDNTVFATTLFADIAKIFLKNPDYAVYVVTRSNKYIGAVLRSDVLEFVKSGALSSKVIADDIMRTDVPPIFAETSLVDAIKAFSETSAEALPMIDGAGRFKGIINRNDIFMAFNEISVRDKLGR